MTYLMKPAGKTKKAPVMLSIAGSDSGSGAGIQIDIKTAYSLNVFCATAITALTAQNPDEVIGIEPVSANFVSLQIEAVGKAFKINAVKTGMLYNRPIIEQVAISITRLKTKACVVDPVCIATSGKRLLLEEAVKALKEKLLPLAYVITPNINEAEFLLGEKINSLSDAKEAAAKLSQGYKTNCVIKGGHLQGEYVQDILYHKGKIYIFKKKRIKTYQTHGSGCTFSAALAAFLARGEVLEKAVEKAQTFVWQALANPIKADKYLPLL